MIGDKVIPKPHHTEAAKQIFKLIKDEIKDGRTAITVAGESGAGKSEIAVEVARFAEEAGITSMVFQQDDYFHLPPKSNEAARKKDIGHVGLSEVNLALLEKNLEAFLNNPDKPIKKPLVVFDEDRVSSETVEVGGYQLAIAEGTYTTLLKRVKHRVFIDRTHVETASHRRERAREGVDEFYDKILEIEHNIISKHKSLASVIVNSDYTVRRTDD